MVTYTEWTSIGHEVYKAKGGTYSGREAAQQVTSTLASYWRENTADLRAASSSEAREIARNAMRV
jgi:hypothetical protein